MRRPTRAGRFRRQRRRAVLQLGCLTGIACTQSRDGTVEVLPGLVVGIAREGHLKAGIARLTRRAARAIDVLGARLGQGTPILVIGEDGLKPAARQLQSLKLLARGWRCHRLGLAHQDNPRQSLTIPPSRHPWANLWAIPGQSLGNPWTNP